VARVLAVVFGVMTVGLTIGLVWSWMFFRSLALKMPVEPPPKIMAKVNEPVQASPLQVSYQLELPGRGEIFPALSVGGAQDYWPVAVINISNQGDSPMLRVISAQVNGWSRIAEQTIVVGPRETRGVTLAPELLPQAYVNEEIRRATLAVRVVDPQ